MLNEEQIKRWIKEHEVCVIETWDRNINRVMSDVFVKLVSRNGESIRFRLTPELQSCFKVNLAERSIVEVTNE